MKYITSFISEESMLLVVGLLFVNAGSVLCQVDLFSAVNNFINDGEAHSLNEPPETTQLLAKYDFIVVGAGSAGCTLANRLTEIFDWKVLLLEAGRNENFIMDVPLAAPLLQLTEANWRYYTEPQASGCLGLVNGWCPWPRGKVVGGSSVLHSMIHTRGNRRDYDRWEKMGNRGWGYKDVLKYFMKSEDMDISGLKEDKEHHNTGGYLTVTHPAWRTPLAVAFLQAGLETGQRVIDYNGATQTGFSYLQTTIRNGTRLSASRAFLHPIRNRPNFHMKKMSMVTRILIDKDSKRAYGVEFERKGRKYQVGFTKEVILSAGTINSPKILMLSGIGPKDHLKELGIDVIQDLKVGYNLQDHIALGGLVFTVNDTVSINTERLLEDPTYVLKYMAYHTGPLSVPSASEAIAFYDTKNPESPDGYPDLELLFIGASFVSNPIYKTVFGVDDVIYDAVFKNLRDKDGWMVYPMLMRPKSRGRLKLRSLNPYHKPKIYPNYLSEPEDLDLIVKGINITIQLSKTKAFQRYASKLNENRIPQCAHHVFTSNDYWKCAVKHLTQTIYHHTGTCKMGPKTDKNAVVDPKLKVYGVKGIRVADASIMPNVPAAHTNAPTIMIGEKIADLIKEDWKK